MRVSTQVTRWTIPQMKRRNWVKSDNNWNVFFFWQSIIRLWHRAKFSLSQVVILLFCSAHKFRINRNAFSVVINSRKWIFMNEIYAVAGCKAHLKWNAYEFSCKWRFVFHSSHPYQNKQLIVSWQDGPFWIIIVKIFHTFPLQLTCWWNVQRKQHLISFIHPGLANV